MAMEAEDHMVIIVGAGPSGLATAACLSNLSIPYIILEREDCFASLWKKYSYDRLHLHLPKPFCELPHMPFPKTHPKYISKKEFLQYLDEYVINFNINPMYKRCVESAVFDETARKWKVKIRNLENGVEEFLNGKFLVVATGETCDAFVPEVEGLGGFMGEFFHSTRYKNGEEFKDKRVLVVGSGNSGMEIAFDLATHGAKTSIVVRSPIHILSRGMASLALFMLKCHVPLNLVDFILVMLSEIVYGDLNSKYGGVGRPQEGPFLSKVKYGKYPIIDVGTFNKINSGEIQVLPAIGSIGGHDVVFDTGESHPFDVIIFATGFKRSTSQWLKGDYNLLKDDGLPKLAFPNHWKGKNGLYCAGLARRGLYGAAMDAQNIANHVHSLLSSLTSSSLV